MPRPTRTRAPTEISIDDDGFAPADLHVRAGERVTWKNDSQLSHDVSPIRGGTWGSGPILPTSAFSQVFSAPGQYDYVCSLHSAMRGRITVEP